MSDEGRKKEQVWVYTQPGVKEGLIRLAKERNYPTLNAMVEEILEQTVAGASPPSDLDGAATVFLAHLDVGHQDLIRDLCKEHGASPADYLLTYIRLAYDRGEASSLEPELRRASDEATPRKTARGEIAPGICGFCGKTFEPTKPGQKYCPDPDDGTPGCGRQATLRALHEHRASRKEPESAFGPNQQHAPPQQDLRQYVRAKETVG